MIFNRAIAALAFFLFANAAVADGVLKGDAAAGEALSALAQPARCRWQQPRTDVSKACRPWRALPSQADERYP